MKTIQEILLNRTSIRRYQRAEITTEQIEFIYNAIGNTPTSYNGQQYSVIAVTDVAQKLSIYDIVGQKQIKTAPLFLIFCLDFHKIAVAAKAIGKEPIPFGETLDGYTVGVIDATLAMQSAMVAAHSMGLGSCCIGYTRTKDPEAIAKLLKLPAEVKVVCGLSIGLPAENPDIKPKQPRSLLIHDNYYHTEKMENELLSYNQTVTEYNLQRSGETSTNDWIEHIESYYQIAMEAEKSR